MELPLRSANRTNGTKDARQREEVPYIEIIDLAVKFDEKVLIEKFSLTLMRGEKVLLTGPSGKGKTTILRSILGFVMPEEGAIKIFGQTLDSHTVWKLRTYIGYVPQEPDFGTGTVREWLEMPFTYRANKGLEKNLKKIPQLFRQFLLPMDLLEKQVQTLSGGEKQRIAIVSVILLDRPILLLDEPTSALDDMSRKKLSEFISSSEITALVASHEPSLSSVVTKTIELT